MEKREMTNSSGTCNLTPLSWRHLTGVDSEWEGSPAFHTAAETETQGGSELAYPGIWAGMQAL